MRSFLVRFAAAHARLDFGGVTRHGWHRVHVSCALAQCYVPHGHGRVERNRPVPLLPPHAYDPASSALTKLIRPKDTVQRSCGGLVDRFPFSPTRRMELAQDISNKSRRITHSTHKGTINQTGDKEQKFYPKIICTEKNRAKP